MFTFSRYNLVACKTLSVVPADHHLTINKTSYVSFNQTSGALLKYDRQNPKVRQLKSMPESMIQGRSGFFVRAFDDDSGAVVVPKAVERETIETLKKDLVELFYGIERGLNASSETRAEIAELISNIEPENPIPAPNDALSILDGNWILVYTSYVGLFPLLSSNALPLFNVDKISQSINSENYTVGNSVQIKSPLATTSFSTNAKFEVRSPRRVQIMFEEGVIGTLQFINSIVLPEDIQFWGRVIDLSTYKSFTTAIEETAASIAKIISSQPPLKFPLRYSSPDSWILTTYLDQDLRIARGDGGSVFVLIKEGSPLLG